MKTFLVTYACRQELDANVISAIKSFPFWARINPKAWIIQTDRNTVEVRNQIKENVPQIDSLLVIGIDGANWATSSVSKEVTDWMKENM